MPSDLVPSRVVLHLAKELSQALGPSSVLTEPEQVSAYARFGWLPPRPRIELPFRLGAPYVVVRPRTADDVALVLRKASDRGVPVVAYGGGTGVMGGAAPVAGGLVLDLGAMNQILNVNPEDLLASVEPGVILSDLAEAAEAKGLLFAHDPWSQPIATVGGAVGTNGVGYLTAGYGVMGDQVRGLEVVLPTGEIAAWNGAAKAPGPALWRTFVGAEGTLGVVTRVIAQLYPLPVARRFAAYRFPSFADGFKAIAEMRAIGLHPSMVDYEEVDEPPLASPADLYLAFDGPSEVVRSTLLVARRTCRDFGGADRGGRAAERFWAHRHDTAYQFMKRASFAPPSEHRPHVVYANVAVPRSRVLSYCSHVVDIARRHGVVVHSFGIWGRPEFVSFILERQSGGMQPGPLELAADDSLLLARQEGGSIEYCHGVGVRLAHLMSEELGSAESMLRRVKTALDPADILNPGKLGLGRPS